MCNIVCRDAFLKGKQQPAHTHFFAPPKFTWIHNLSMFNIIAYTQWQSWFLTKQNAILSIPKSRLDSFIPKHLLRPDNNDTYVCFERFTFILPWNTHTSFNWNATYVMWCCVLCVWCGVIMLNKRGESTHLNIVQCRYYSTDMVVTYPSIQQSLRPIQYLNYTQQNYYFSFMLMRSILCHRHPSTTHYIRRIDDRL